MTSTEDEGSRVPAPNLSHLDDEPSSQKVEYYTITPVRTPTDLSAVIELFKAYALSLNLDLSFQDFTNELAGLPGKYSPDQGGELLLARNTITGEAVGCIALRSITPTLSFLSSPASANHQEQQQQNKERTAELKRLYVVPSTRKTGLGRRLANEMIGIARGHRYTEIKLDTLPSMAAAQRMYEGLGFVDIEPYCFNPVEGVRFLGLRLRDA